MAKVKTRFAPSPTGYLHIGGLRTALFSYLFAKKNKGDFLLRIEDTDQQRLVPGAAEKLIATLKNLGLKPDGRVEHQSRRLKLYQTAVAKLIQDKYAYYCFCSSDRLAKLREREQAAKKVPKYDGHCRSLTIEECANRIKAGEKYVVRFKIPSEQNITAQDTVYGKISVKSEDLDDFIILKSDGFPTYHLANVVDDHDMAITHVIRADEWLPSLPKHILLYRAFGYTLPTFVHLPLLLNPDKSKLSKRQGDVAVEDYQTKGYLKEAMINYVALLGWNPGSDREMFSLDELTNEFSLEKINKSGAIFDIKKLNWFNAEYIRHIVQKKDKHYQALLKQIASFMPEQSDRAQDLLKLFGNRLEYLGQLPELSKFLFELPDYSPNLLIFKKSDKTKTKQGLKLALDILEKLPAKKWQDKDLQELLQNLANTHGLTAGDIFWPIRVALSGLEKSPSPTEILEFLGKKDSLKRLKMAINKLK